MSFFKRIFGGPSRRKAAANAAAAAATTAAENAAAIQRAQGNSINALQEQQAQLDRAAGRSRRRTRGRAVLRAARGAAPAA